MFKLAEEVTPSFEFDVENDDNSAYQCRPTLDRGNLQQHPLAREIIKSPTEYIDLFSAERIFQVPCR